MRITSSPSWGVRVLGRSVSLGRVRRFSCALAFARGAAFLGVLPVCPAVLQRGRELLRARQRAGLPAGVACWFALGASVLWLAGPL